MQLLNRPLPESRENFSEVVSKEELRKIVSDMLREKCLGLHDCQIEVCAGFVSTKNGLLLTSDAIMKKTADLEGAV